MFLLLVIVIVVIINVIIIIMMKKMTQSERSVRWNYLYIIYLFKKPALSVRLRAAFT